MTDNERKSEFAWALADQLTHSLAKKSIDLQMEKPEAKQWARTWAACGLFGYPTKGEAARQIADFLGFELGPDK